MSKPNTVEEVLKEFGAGIVEEVVKIERNSLGEMLNAKPDELVEWYTTRLKEAAHSLNELYLNKYLELVGADEVLPAWKDWYAKTKPYGGSQEEYHRLKAIINNENNFRNRLREEARKAFKEGQDG